MRTSEEKFSSQKMADTLAKRKIVRRRIRLRRLTACERMVRLAINAHGDLEPVPRDVGVLSEYVNGHQFDAAKRRHDERHQRLVVIMDELNAEREHLTKTMAVSAVLKQHKDVIPPTKPGERSCTN